MPAPIVDLSGKNIMITGFTAGIGEAAGHALAEMGANLYLVCRNAQKGRATIESIHADHPSVQAEMIVGDLGRLADVRAIADDFVGRDRPLDVLFNNAGVVMQSRDETLDGYEVSFAVNHLSHFLLTNLLLPQLRAAPAARVVSTASDAHKFFAGPIRFDDLQSTKRYTTFGAYGRSKLANILFTRELARREAATNVSANAYHPGFVGSDFAKNNGKASRALMNLISPFARTSAHGAETGVYLCSSPEVASVSGSYFYNMKSHKPAETALRDEDARQLWDVSCELTGLSA